MTKATNHAWSSSSATEEQFANRGQRFSVADPYNSSLQQQRQQSQCLLPSNLSQQQPSGLGKKQQQAQAGLGSPLGRKLNLLTFNRNRQTSEKSLAGLRDDASSSNVSSTASSNEFIQFPSGKPVEGNGRRQEESRRKSCSIILALLKSAMKFTALVVAISLLVYFWPMEEPEIEPKLAQFKPRPKFQAELQLNDLLNSDSELLFQEQFHAPESMAWSQDKRSFYTGVEGGFILRIEPYEERWSVVARLNSKRWPAFDLSGGVRFVQEQSRDSELGKSASNSSEGQLVPFCSADVELYGHRAEFEPKLVPLSRCSRPLGMRLSPDQHYLYTIDPFSGLYKIQLPANEEQAKVFKLIDFTQYHDKKLSLEREKKIIFGDDIAVEFEQDGQDLIYISDCSTRWTLRYLFRMIVENDDTGRVLKFHTRDKIIYKLNNITPVEASNSEIDSRNLSFPNGVELTADKQALLVSDLNNRRILRYDLKSGKSKHLLWVPGYPDNVRRGLDSKDGTPTYWAACGCAVSDGKFEIAEFFNLHPQLRKLLLKLLHFSGSIIEFVGQTFSSVCLQDAGLLIKASWFKRDPYCNHGLVLQFNENGQVLQSLHASGFHSSFRMISEAHQVPIVDDISINSTQSHLYLGSVYYSYLGRLKLNDSVAANLRR